MSEVLEKEENMSSKDVLNSKKKILIVDDNEDVLKVLSKGLEHLGYEVITETNSVNALISFKAEYNNINLIITDYMMPNLNGIEFSKAIKELKENIGIILITGYMDEDKKVIKKSSLIDEIFSKPIEINKLSEAVKRVQSKYENNL